MKLVVYDATQEMRRPAPPERQAKRQRSNPAEEEVGEHEGFQELSRFDYAAADSLGTDSQGFLLTCGFRRHALPLS